MQSRIERLGQITKNVYFLIFWEEDMNKFKVSSALQSKSVDIREVIALYEYLEADLLSCRNNFNDDI